MDNHVWIVEANNDTVHEFPKHKWHPLRGFTTLDTLGESPLHAIRGAARKAAKGMFEKNTYNHLTSGWIAVKYRARKYIPADPEPSQLAQAMKTQGYTLVPDLDNQPETDYIMVGDVGPDQIQLCWIQVGDIALYIRHYPKGVAVDATPVGDAEATLDSMFVHFEDVK